MAAYNKLNNTTPLNTNGSWSPAGFPTTTADTATWNAVVTGANAAALGGALTVGGLTLTNPGGVITIGTTAAALSIGPSGINTAAASGSTGLTIASPVTITLLANQDWNVGSAGPLTVSSTISGAFSLSKLSIGTLSMTSSASTFSGGITLSGGTTSVGASSAGAVGAVTAGPLGTGPITFNGGAIAASVTATLNNAITVSNDITHASGSLTLAAPINFAGFSRTVTVTAGSLTLSGIISGGGSGLTKAGAQTLTLGGANTLSGSITINAGTLAANSATALGAVRTTSLTVASGGTLGVGAALAYPNFSTSIAGTGASSTGAINFTSIVTANLGTITLTDAATIRSGVAGGTLSSATIATTASNYALTLAYGSGSGGTFTVSSQITGGGALNVTGGNATGQIVALTNTTSNFTGQVSVNGAQLQAASFANEGVASSLGSATGPAATIKLGSGSNLGVLAYSGGTGNQTTNRVIDFASTTGTAYLNNNVANTTLTFTSNFTATGSGAKNFQPFAGGNATLRIEGVIPDSSGGATSITPGLGGGIVVFAGLNTYTGSTAYAGSGANSGLSVNSISRVDTPAASALGAPTTIANGTISLGSTTNVGNLTYTGGAVSTDRVINLAGTTGSATLSNNGTGALVFESALTATGVGAKTLTLAGSNTDANNFLGAITNASGNVISLTKAGVGYWKATGANSYTGGVLVSGGQLDITELTTLGSLASNKTLQVTTASARNSSALLNVATTYPSTLSWSLSSAGSDQTNSALGAIRALADSVISGTVTLTGTSTLYANTGDLTVNGLISGSSTIQARMDTGRTLTIAGGISGTGRLTTFGPGTAVWLGSAANTATLSTIINGGTLRLALNGSLSQYAFTILSFGATAAQTASPTSRHQYTGGTVEFSNSGASGAINYAGLTATNALDLSRGSGKVKLSRDAAQDFTVTLGNTSQPANGYLTLEYGGTNPGTIGTESNIRFPSLSNGQIRTLIYSPTYSAMVPVWVDPTSRVAYRMLYDGSQNLVAASQLGGTTLTLLTQSGATYNFGFYNLTGDLSAQTSARVNSIRFDTTTTTPITLASGAILQAQELIDVSTGTARTIVAGATGAKLARNVGGSGTFAVYTNNVTGTGATISADLDARYNATFTKAGVGLLTLTGAVDNLSGFQLADGSVSFPVGSSFNNPFATLTVANKDSSEAVPATNATFAQSGDVVVAGLSGGGANTAVTLNGGDLVLRSAGTTTFGGDIVLGGSQKLKVQSLSIVPETSSGLQAFQGAFPFTAIEMTRGNISLDPQYGLTFTGASAPSITATGGSTFNIQAQNPLSADYTVALGALTASVGALRVQLANATTSGNPYNTRVTAASLTVTGDSVATLLNHTANPQMSFTVSSVTTAGPMGSGVNVYNGGNIAYYRLAGSTLAGTAQNFTGGVALVDTVDAPVYGTGAAGDTNFPASKSAFASFASSATDNINVIGAQSAQTSQTMRSLRISATTVTMASSSARLTTDLIIFTSTSPQLLGGEVAAQDASGNLYVVANGTSVLSSKVTNNGANPTKLILLSTNGLTLSGANDHSGGTFIPGGGATVTLTNTSALGTGPVIGNGGNGFTLASPVTTFTFNAGNAITLNDGGLRLDAPVGTAYALNGAIGGTGDLYLTGAGTFALGAVGAGTGALRMSSSSTVTVNAAQAFTEYDFNNGSLTFRYSSGFTTDISALVTKRPGNTYRIDTNGESVTWASSFGNGSTYVKVGAGTHTLGAENFLATVTVTTGTVKAGHVSALGYGSVTLSAGTTLQTLTTGGQNGKVTVASLTNSAGGTIRIGG